MSGGECVEGSSPAEEEHEGEPAPPPMFGAHVANQIEPGQQPLAGGSSTSLDAADAATNDDGYGAGAASSSSSSPFATPTEEPPLFGTDPNGQQPQSQRLPGGFLTGLAAANASSGDNVDNDEDAVVGTQPPEQGDALPSNRALDADGTVTEDYGDYNGSCGGREEEEEDGNDGLRLKSSFPPPDTPSPSSSFNARGASDEVCTTSIATDPAVVDALRALDKCWMTVDTSGTTAIATTPEVIDALRALDTMWVSPSGDEAGSSVPGSCDGGKEVPRESIWTKPVTDGSTGSAGPVDEGAEPGVGPDGQDRSDPIELDNAAASLPDNGDGRRNRRRWRGQGQRNNTLSSFLRLGRRGGQIPGENSDDEDGGLLLEGGEEGSIASAADADIGASDGIVAGNEAGATLHQEVSLLAIPDGGDDDRIDLGSRSLDDLIDLGTNADENSARKRNPLSFLMLGRGGERRLSSHNDDAKDNADSNDNEDDTDADDEDENCNDIGVLGGKSSGLLLDAEGKDEAAPVAPRRRRIRRWGVGRPRKDNSDSDIDDEGASAPLSVTSIDDGAEVHEGLAYTPTSMKTSVAIGDQTSSLYSFGDSDVAVATGTSRLEEDGDAGSGNDDSDSGGSSDKDEGDGGYGGDSPYGTGDNESLIRGEEMEEIGPLRWSRRWGRESALKNNESLLNKGCEEETRARVKMEGLGCSEDDSKRGANNKNLGGIITSLRQRRTRARASFNDATLDKSQVKKLEESIITEHSSRLDQMGIETAVDLSLKDQRKIFWKEGLKLNHTMALEAVLAPALCVDSMIEPENGDGNLGYYRSVSCDGDDKSDGDHHFAGRTDPSAMKPMEVMTTAKGEEGTWRNSLSRAASAVLVPELHIDQRGESCEKGEYRFVATDVEEGEEESEGGVKDAVEGQLREQVLTLTRRVVELEGLLKEKVREATEWRTRSSELEAKLGGSRAKDTGKNEGNESENAKETNWLLDLREDDVDENGSEGVNTSAEENDGIFESHDAADDLKNLSHSNGEPGTIHLHNENAMQKGLLLNL